MSGRGLLHTRAALRSISHGGGDDAQVLPATRRARQPNPRPLGHHLHARFACCASHDEPRSPHAHRRQFLRLSLVTRGDGRSKFTKFCRRRAQLLGTNVRRGSPFDGRRPSQCLRCDRGQHRRCARLPTCWARFRSPNGIRRRDLNRAAQRAQRQQRTKGAPPPDATAPIRHLLPPRHNSASVAERRRQAERGRGRRG